MSAFIRIRDQFSDLRIIRSEVSVCISEECQDGLLYELRETDTHTTRIEVRLMPNRLNVWTCFGRTVHEQYLGPIWRALYFAPGSTFGVVQRIENLHATAIHRLLVLRTFESGEITRATGASSGYAQLLRVAGSRKVNLVLALIDAIQDQDIDPADACPDYWRVLHWRLATHRDPHFYTRAEHQFYLDQMVQKP
jgi:hypothetical protein